MQEQGDFDGALMSLRGALAFAESEKAAKPEDVKALWRLADCYKRYGQYYQALARRAKPPEEGRSVQKQACDWYEKGLQQWDEWPRFAVSSVFNTTRREAAAQTAARCESQLKR